VAKEQKRGNRETRKPKQVKAAAQPANPFAPQGKAPPSGNASGSKGKG